MPSISGVESFAEGTWNNREITAADLQSIANAFKATASHVRPVLKLGHDDDQKLVQRDGLPAAGWIANVYVKGKKLLADFVDIPRKIFDLIERRAYRKVSVELYKGYTFDGKTYDWLLGAVALLGADTPAVQTLADIIAAYSAEAKPEIFTITPDDVKMGSKQIPTKLELTNMPEHDTDIEARLEKFKIAGDAAVEHNKKLESEFAAFKLESTATISRLERERIAAEIERFTTSLVAADLASKSMLPYLLALAETNVREDFTIDGAKLSGLTAIEGLLKLAKEVYAINKTERSEAGDKQDTNTEGHIAKLIADKMSGDKSLTYSAAYRSVMKERN